MDKKTINIALQGGGSHGAFTWGVLDALLEDERLAFEGITATSAGAMNAAIMAHGITNGGEDAAREALENFWSEISKAGAIFAPVKRTPAEFTAALNPFMPDWGLDQSPYFTFFENLTARFSPYDFNPLNFNPLREVLERCIDFDAVHACNRLKLFVTATNVRSGTAKVFENKDITIDVLLASAALPFLFHAVEIDGEPYWDGGYLGNPSLWPLFYHAKSRDIVIIHVNPILREELPTTAYEIENRVNEITFNASLLKELRAIDFVQKLLHDDMLKDKYKKRYTDVLLHAVRADGVMSDLSVASKFDTSWSFLLNLRDRGREEAKNWLEKNFDDLGQRSSVNIQDDYLQRGK